MYLSNYVTAQWARAFSTMGGSSLNMEFGLSGGIKNISSLNQGAFLRCPRTNLS